MFSALINGQTGFIAETVRRRTNIRIELPGNPILGDGKSDNQNHPIIFYFGMQTLIMLLYITLSLQISHLIYFWITTLSLYLSPFIFNPHQVSFADFVVNYRYEKVDSVQLFSVILIYFTGNTSNGCLAVMLGHTRMLGLDTIGYLEL